MIASILIHRDFLRAFYTETDISNFTLEAILIEIEEEEEIHQVAFYSRNFLAIEINYKIHDKELLAIVNLFQE